MFRHGPQGSDQMIDEMDLYLFDGYGTVRQSVGRPTRDGIQSKGHPTLHFHGRRDATGFLSTAAPRFSVFVSVPTRRGTIGSVILFVVIIEGFELFHDEIQRIPPYNGTRIFGDGPEIDAIPDAFVVRHVIEEAVDADDRRCRPDRSLWSDNDIGVAPDADRPCRRGRCRRRAVDPRRCRTPNEEFAMDRRGEARRR